MFENDYIQVIEHRLVPRHASIPSCSGDCMLVSLTATTLRINGKHQDRSRTWRSTGPTWASIRSRRSAIQKRGSWWRDSKGNGRR